MNLKETGDVLAAIQIYDARKVDQATIKAWNKMLWRFTLQDCLQAVEDYFTTETDYLKPAHIIGRVKRIRSRRLELAGGIHLLPEDEYDDDGNLQPDYKQKADHLTDLIANGQLSVNQYEAYQERTISLQQLGQQARAIEQ